MHHRSTHATPSDHHRPGLTVLLAAVFLATVFLATVFLAAVSAPPAWADNVTSSQIVQSFDLGGGIAGEVVLTFEEASGLDATSLDISAQLVDLSNPCAVCNRLPSGVFLPARFPVLISIEPNVAGLTFQGRYTLELITDRLSFTDSTPLRLFRARNSVAQFEDITDTVGLGSYRALGIGGSFSEFVIAADLRPIGRVIEDKFDFLDAVLDDPISGIDPVLLIGLVAQLGNAQAAWQNGNINQARALLAALIQAVIDNSGNGIPDTWDPPLQPVSIAGRLRGALRSLRFSLSISDRPEGLDNNSLTVELEPGPGLELEVELVFEGSFDIDLEDLGNDGLGLTAEVIDPVDLLDRLPLGVQVPEEFPVLLRIDPALDQTFGDRFTIALRTENLPFLGNTPYRLFKAPDGGTFVDITATFGIGSYRALGIGGSFSEFVIGEDARPLSAILAGKVDRVENFLILHDSDIPQVVIDAFTPVVTAIDAADWDLAIHALDDFRRDLRANLEDIPAIWRPDGSMVNVAGELQSFIGALRLTLVLLDTPVEADPADVNGDGQVDLSDVFAVIERVFGQGVPLM